MYFPYLRGKQYELLALKELSVLLGKQQKVIPIIEPVRSPNGSGLDRCLTAMHDASIGFVLVLNPSVGELRNPHVAPELAQYLSEQNRSTNWNLGLLIDERTNVADLIANYREQIAGQGRLTLIHKGIAEGLGELPSLTSDLRREFDVIDDRWRRRYFRDLLASSQGITLRDGFPGEERNAAYLGKEESVFTDDHLFYVEESWFGFSDYLTIGEPYADGGFTPRAVAIHWTYEPHPGAPILIRHFTSESNGDTANVGGKFLEAARKLVAFLDLHDIHTEASEVFRSHVANSTYPGLGIVKKLSIQNHLELMSGILSRP
ncbi:sce7725 family protein [Humibacter albus]|uniref:sce7725 family protein n=1 Tax=Humibacter albus TaxID=427754 RepID=UPI000524E1B1|nr:sce7725 family protein [Humibacter albus]